VRKLWIFLITIGVFIGLVLLLMRLQMFDAWMFSGIFFYLFIFLGGYFFVMINKERERKRLEDEANLKQKFDWCWDRVNRILRRMPGGQGLEWASGFGRESEYRTFYDGVQNHGFRSMMGYLSTTQQLVIVIYDINRDDIVRFVTNPDPDLLDNHFRYFKPFSRGGGGYDENNPYNPYNNPYYNRGKPPISINVGGEGYDSARKPEQFGSKPDDDMVESAVKRIKE
jgi:Ca2+/Na+ antiporter